MATIETKAFPAGNDLVNGTLTIACAGQTITVRLGDFNDSIREAAMLHGFKQKIVDAAALSVNPDTGKSATAEDKLLAMRDVVTQLSQGDWNRRATGDGTGNQGLLVAALIRVTGNDAATVEATVGAWDAATQAAMRASPQVAPVIATIKAERAAKRPEVARVDAGALLSGLMAQTGKLKTTPVAQTPVKVTVAKKA